MEGTEVTEIKFWKEKQSDNITKRKANNNMIDAIKYVQENKLEKEANNLANEVGDIYMACVMLFYNVPQSKRNINACKEIVADRKKGIKSNGKSFDI